MNVWKMKVNFLKKLLRGDKKTILISIIMIGILALAIYSLLGSNPEPLNVVETIDPEAYTGQWFSVYEIPVYYGFWPFGYDSTKCNTPTASYTIEEETIKVINACLLNGKQTFVEGTARFKTPDNPNGELFVKFFLFESDYNILGLGPIYEWAGKNYYEWAVVGTLDRDGLWFLNRGGKGTMTPEIYDEMLLIAQNNGFDTTKLVETK